MSLLLIEGFVEKNVIKNSKNRKYEEENKTFKPESEEDFGFTNIGDETVSACFSQSLQNYKAKHKNFAINYQHISYLRSNLGS